MSVRIVQNDHSLRCYLFYFDGVLLVLGVAVEVVKVMEVGAVEAATAAAVEEDVVVVMVVVMVVVVVVVVVLFY